jgi:nucleoside-diphosphate-sugar epimerase
MREETFWKDVPVLITGAAGFVGANLAQRLNNLGANVICLIRNTKKFSSLEALGIADKVEIIESKSFSVRKLESILSGHKINAVFHLAAKAIVNEANDSPFEAFEVNIKGTYSLLEACRKKKKRLNVLSWLPVIARMAKKRFRRFTKICRCWGYCPTMLQKFAPMSLPVLLLTVMICRLRLLDFLTFTDPET